MNVAVLVVDHDFQWISGVTLKLQINFINEPKRDGVYRRQDLRIIAA